MQNITDETRYELRKTALREEGARLISMWLDRYSAAIDIEDWLTAAEAMQYINRLSAEYFRHAGNVAAFEGATWEQIGERFHMSKQGAQQKFTRYRGDDISGD